MLFRIVDVETTGMDPTEHALVEIDRTDVSDGVVTRTRGYLIRPPHPIPPEASAVHHLTDADVENSASARDLVPEILQPEDDCIYVAHNARFERDFLAPYLPDDARWICTFKVALRVWPDAPGHSNQVLRYWRGLRLDVGAAHRAGPDTVITAHLFTALLEHASVEDMLAWTAEPPVFPRVSFGKHKGSTWADLPADYLDWIINKPNDLDDDLKWNARREHERRVEAARAEFAKKRKAYLSLALFAVSISPSVNDLVSWFKEQASNRRIHGVFDDTDEYRDIVAACANRKAELQKSLGHTENGGPTPTMETNDADSDRRDAA